MPKNKKVSVKKVKELVKKENDEKIVKVKSGVRESQAPVKPKMKKFEIKYVILLLLVAVISAIIYFGRTQLVVATVNGKPISRLALIMELEKQGGKQVLDSLVTKTLIQEEVKKQNIVVAPEELAAEIKKIEDRFSGQEQSFDQVLALQGMTRQDLNEQIGMELAVKKLAGKDLAVTDEEVDKYIEDNKESLGEVAPTEESRNKIKESLLDEKSNAKIQEWLNNVKTKAEIKYFRIY